MVDLMSNPLFGELPQYSNQVGNTLDINALLGANNRPSQPARYVERDPKHTGVAGVARDVFGTLGDILLSGIGVGPLYRNAQQRRKLNAAFEGFDQDPDAAIQRVMSIDPAQGFQLRDQVARQRLQAENNARMQGQAERQLSAEERLAKSAEFAQEEARFKRMEQGWDSVARMLSAVKGWDQSRIEKDWPSYRNVIVRQASRYGLNPDDIPFDYDPVEIEALVAGGIPLTNQLSAETAALNREASAVRQREAIKASDARSAATIASRESEGAKNREQRDRLAANKEAGKAASNPALDVLSSKRQAIPPTFQLKRDKNGKEYYLDTKTNQIYDIGGTV